MAHYQIAHRSLVCLQCGGDLSLFDCDLLDLTIGAPHIQNLACLVELRTVRDSIASVYVHDFLDHPDVPYLDHAIGVRGGDVLASDGELSIVDGVQMTVESLHSEARAHVPN